MSTIHFQSNRTKAGKPFPRTADEWIEKGRTPEQAEDIMRKDVFGHDYKLDASGNPIEKGIGSASQQTPQHLQELDRSREADLARKMRLGWHPGMEGAFDPRVQAEIDRQVEARVKAALKEKRAKPKRKAAKKIEPAEVAA